MPDLENFGDWSEAVAATGGQPGAHWLGNMEESQLYAEFSRQSRQVMVAGDAGSEPKIENDLPVYEDEIIIKVYMPGGNVMARTMLEEDKIKYRLAWEAFERGDGVTIKGIPLKEWPEATPSVIATLTAAHVYSVEQLADLPDGHCEQIGNLAFLYRDKAKAYMERAHGQNAQMEQLREQNQSLAAQMQEMAAELETLKMTKPRRGRPPVSKNKVRNVTTDHDTRDGGPAEAPTT